jgi:DNA-binding transcriptional LysR family regulator
VPCDNSRRSLWVIARLEEEVGAALITRLGRGVRLTDAGLTLVEHPDAVLMRLTAAEEDVAAIAGLRAGRVRLVTFPSGSATLMAGALTRLRAAHPGVDVSFEEAEPEDAIPQLRSGDADLVLGFSYRAVARRCELGVTLQPALALALAATPAVAALGIKAA